MMEENFWYLTVLLFTSSLSQKLAMITEFVNIKVIYFMKENPEKLLILLFIARI
jgi:hypothetical protein